jgi:hypothetical protein
LGAVRRQASVFDIYSTPGVGTVVMARVNLERSTGAAGSFTWGSVSLPKPPELVCGDAWRVLTRSSEVAVLVADGLGHGPLAATAARKAADVFEELAFAEPRTIIERAHAAMSGTRGAAVAIARANGTGRLDYAGVGNIAGTVAAAERNAGLVSQNGTVGVQVRKLQQMEYSWPHRGVLIMHSDGLSQRWSLDAYPGLRMRHPAVIAGVLSRDFGRGHDDATVVVVARDGAETAHA